MTMTPLLEIVGALMGAWGLGFVFGHVLKFFRNLIHSI